MHRRRLSLASIARPTIFASYQVLGGWNHTHFGTLAVHVVRRHACLPCPLVNELLAVLEVRLEEIIHGPLQLAVREGAPVAVRTAGVGGDGRQRRDAGSDAGGAVGVSSGGAGEGIWGGRWRQEGIASRRGRPLCLRTDGEVGMGCLWHGSECSASSVAADVVVMRVEARVSSLIVVLLFVVWSRAIGHISV